MKYFLISLLFISFSVLGSTFIPLPVNPPNAPILSAKGDIFTNDGTNDVILSADTNNKALVLNSATTQGMEWILLSPDNFADRYSETEITYGTWNGSQLYRRCFTIASDITVNNTVITTWVANLNPVGLVNYAVDDWILGDRTVGSSSSGVAYRRDDGTIRCFITGTYKCGANTEICMNYTK